MLSRQTHLTKTLPLAWWRTAMMLQLKRVWYQSTPCCCYGMKQTERGQSERTALQRAHSDCRVHCRIPARVCHRFQFRAHCLTALETVAHDTVRGLLQWAADVADVSEFWLVAPAVIKVGRHPTIPARMAVPTAETRVQMREAVATSMATAAVAAQTASALRAASQTARRSRHATQRGIHSEKSVDAGGIDAAAAAVPARA